MNRLESALVQLATDLTQLRARWALVGGMALALRGIPRMTFDLDVVVAVGEEAEADRVVADLRARGYSTLELLEHDATERLATARLTVPHRDRGGLIVDLLFASSGVEAEIVATADRLVVMEGLALPVATTGHLIALKLLAARPQDLADAENLLKMASEADVQLARETLDQISRRGFDRGQDLAADFLSLIARSD